MPIPTTEMIDSKTVHVCNVCLIVKSKYSLNIQKPASLTCDAASEPAPMARTIKAGSTPDCAINGATIPAAVNDATVADPQGQFEAQPQLTSQELMVTLTSLRKF